MKSRTSHTRTILSALALMLALTTALPAFAGVELNAIELTKGKSMVLDSVQPIKRVSVADPETATIMLLSPNQIYLTGVKPGTTNLTLWGFDGRVSKVYDVSVSPDVSQLKEMLHRILPDERNIRVIAAGESITMSGTVKSSSNVSTALELAELYAPEKVTNLMNVGGVHQVMLEVKIAEMNRNVMERIGIDLSYYFNGNFAFTLLNDMFQLDNMNGPLPLANDAAINSGATFRREWMSRINPSRNGMFRFNTGQATWTGFLDVLKENGLVKVLAEPTLICRSGEEAQFLAGGEIPVPIPQGLGSVAIEYKPYGVALKFQPTVLSGDRISLKVFPEVSELDFSNAITLSGFEIPAITSRRTTTTVELGSGQSFAIAGLVRDQVRETIKKYPGLGDIPMLGALFRSSEFQKNESELVIIVTPHLAKPMKVVDGSLPTDHYHEPTEMEFFLMGKMEGKAPKQAASVKPVAQKVVPGSKTPPATGMEGNFGHILPGQE